MPKKTVIKVQGLYTTRNLRDPELLRRANYLIKYSVDCTKSDMAPQGVIAVCIDAIRRLDDWGYTRKAAIVRGQLFRYRERLQRLKIADLQELEGLP